MSSEEKIETTNLQIGEKVKNEEKENCTVENIMKDEKKESSVKKPEKKHCKITIKKLAMTAVFFISYAPLAFLNSISGVTVTLLAYLTSVDTNTAVYYFTWRGVGTLFGPFLSGLIYDYIISSKYVHSFDGACLTKKLFCKLTLTKCLIIILAIEAILNLIEPFVSSQGWLIALSLSQGLFMSSLENGVYTSIAMIWKDYTRPAFQLLTSMYGATSVLFPLVLSFLFTYFDTKADQLLFSYELVAALTYFPIILLIVTPSPDLTFKDDGNFEDEIIKTEEKNIELKDEKEKKENNKELEKKSLINWKKVKNAIKETFWEIISVEMLMYFLMAILNFILDGGFLVGLPSLLLYFGVTKGNLGNESSLSLLNSFFWVVFAVSSLFWAGVSYVLPPWLILIIFSSALFILNFIWIFLSNSQVALWIIILLIAFFCPPIQSCILCTSEETFHARRTAVRQAVLLFFQYTGEMLYPSFTSFTTQIIGGDGLVWVLFVSLIINFIVYGIYMVVGCLFLCFKKKKDEKKETPLQNEKEEKI